MKIFEINTNNLKSLADFLPVIDDNDISIKEKVQTIIEKVKKYGVNACIDYTYKFDGVKLDKDSILIDVKKAKVPDINNSLFEKALNKASNNILKFHSKQKVTPFKIKEGKNFCEERWMPLNRVGCYVPGGSAPLISTVMMTVIPAKVAKVSSVVVCTPPQKDGKVHPLILYLCKKLKVDKILLSGGAHGIAALSYGFSNFLPVDKIVGPGNKYVTEAKRQVFGDVSIDMLAGPSEVLIIADKTASSAHIASDLLAQLEHDKDASGVLVTDSKDIIEKVEKEILKQKELLSRKMIIEGSLKNLKLIYTDKIENALKIADFLSPEHLEIMVKNISKFAKYNFKAGAVFLGGYTPVAVGDFFGGTNHVLPTKRRAAFSSPLSLYDFMRRVQYIHYSHKKLQKDLRLIESIAEMECLPAHKNSVSIRMIK